jgi:hypothetical protein
MWKVIYRPLLWISLVLGLVALACNAVTALPPTPAPEDPISGQVVATTIASEPAVVTAIPSEPVPLREGLASLDSYRLHVTFDSTGPSPADRTSSQTIVEYNGPADARHSRMTIFTSSEDSPDGNQEVSEEYQVGNETCQLMDEEWQYRTLTPVQREIVDLMGSILDLRPPVENAVLVGEEVVNGVPSRHYTFNLAGLGSKSGAEVTQSGGEYWLAQDGRYLVKYSLIIAMRTAPEGSPEAEAVEGSMSLELQDINQPISIALPTDCLANRESE